MNIQIYNTASRKKEIFKPIKSGHVSMYHCGPTVYDFAHIGNLRSYVFADTLRRTFEYNDYKIDQVINITDVGHLVSDGDIGEDKMTKALTREKRDITVEAMLEVAEKYAKYFIEDLVSLNIELPQHFPRASAYIKQDIELIRELEKKGIAYKIADGMYFDTNKFPDYGKLVGGKGKLQWNEEFSRVIPAQGKRNHLDFALWKFDSKLGWDSDLGKGFPGWHIECSAMSRTILGQPFDIHTGGIDHIPVHHTNEIAQSEAAYGTPLANYWMHNAFITVDNAKMAKSVGGFVTLRSLGEAKISALSYRYWLLTSHYRSPANFTMEAVQASQHTLIRLMDIVRQYPEGGEIIASYQEKFNTFINDDLNMPQAVALVWELIKDESHPDANKRATILDFDRVFGLKLSSVPKAEEKIPDVIQALADAREEARKAKDFKKADALRHEIESRGYTISDTAGGLKIRASD